MARPLHQKLFWILILFLPTQLGLHFWPEWAAVFGIRVDYLSPTIYLTDLMVVGILASWSAPVILRAKPEGSRNLFAHIRARFLDFARNDNLRTAKIFLLVVCYLLLTSLFVAENQGAALYKLAKVIEFSLLGFYVCKNGFSTIHYSLFIIPLLLSFLLAWFQFLGGHTLGLWILGERSFGVTTPGIALVNLGGTPYLRPYATFPHPNILAGFLLVGTVLIFNSQFKASNWLTRVAFGSVMTTLIITFSHSAWLAGVAAGAIYFLPALWPRIQSLARTLLLTLVVGSIFLPAVLVPADLDQNVRQRLELGRAALLATSDHLLTGVGLNNFIVQLPKYGDNLGVSWWLQPVHNIYLLVLVETGLIGFVFLVWFLSRVIAQLTIAHKPYAICVFIILVTGFLDHYWLTVQQGQLMTAIVLGALFSRQKEV